MRSLCNHSQYYWFVERVFSLLWINSCIRASICDFRPMTQFNILLGQYTYMWNFKVQRRLLFWQIERGKFYWFDDLLTNSFQNSIYTAMSSVQFRDIWWIAPIHKNLLNMKGLEIFLGAWHSIDFRKANGSLLLSIHAQHLIFIQLIGLPRLNMPSDSAES